MAAVVVRLFDTRTQALQVLDPIAPGHVGMYVCGPTVQSSPHIGHLRSAIAYDLMRRWLEHRGLTVTLIRNVTDVDDKVLAVGGDTWWALAYRVELEFADAYRAVGVLPPTYEPRATANIDRMQTLIGALLDRGHAYPSPDGSGDVWFDTASWPDYGALTRQRGEAQEPGEDADARAKRDPRDFALWKGRKSDEPVSASWSSPWGEGRPGWHVECSAMAERYLGTAFDIHGGGLDLRFPHHENELAQSSAAGHAFARLWTHNGLVTINGQKMSKSLGNSVFAGDLLGAARGVVVRYALGAAHYRSALDHHPTALVEAEEAVARIERFLARAAERLEIGALNGGVPVAVPDAFAAAMDDDLGVPQALAVLHDTVRRGNQALDADDLAAGGEAQGAVRAMTSVLGFDLEGSQAPERARAALSVLVDRAVDQRRAARAARDWAGADRIRGELAAAGVILEDSATGTRWSLEDGRGR